MHAVVFKHREEFGKIEVNDRFDFEDRFLHTLFHPRRSRKYLDHHPSLLGVHVFLDPESLDFKAKPYLEFEKQVLNEAHFHVMQEGQPTGFTVIFC